MRTEDGNTRMKNLKQFYRIYNGFLQPAIVLKMTGCFLVISEEAVSMCLKKRLLQKISR